MRHILGFCTLVVLGFPSAAQYWFGPKFGMSYIDHIYQESAYERDSFNVPKNINFQAGAVFEYTATSMYSVYGEIMYEKIGKKVTDKATDGQSISASMTNHFISVPVMLRVSLGTAPVHYYLNGGPRLSYWVAGSGYHDLEEFEEFPPLGFDENENPITKIPYKLTFKSSKALEGEPTTAFTDKPNRLQFGLTLGGGVYFDLTSGGRLQLDFRMTWVHSNMGANSARDTNLARESYRENLEYYHNISSLSVAYLFGYNSDLKRKGKSTSDESNKKKKK